MSGLQRMKYKYPVNMKNDQLAVQKLQFPLIPEGMAGFKEQITDSRICW